MKQLWAVVALTLVLLAGCSSSTESSKEATDGESIYGMKCAACHGGNLKGAVGPPVENMGSKYSESELTKLINEGTEKMPGQHLTDEESKTVVEWLIKK